MPEGAASNPSPAVALRAAGMLALVKVVRAIVPAAGPRSEQRPGESPRRSDTPSQGQKPGPDRRAKTSDDRTGHAAKEPGRGREAETPAQIPARGWKDVLWRVYERFGHDRVLAIAAGVTFYALLAIFPAIGALVSLYGLFADPGTIQNHLNTLGGFLPGGALDVIGEQVKRIASKPSGTLGFGFALGLGTALWSSNAGMKALFDALNIVYQEEEKRGFFKLNLVSLTFTLSAILFILLAIGGVVVLPIVLKWLPVGGPIVEWTLSLLRWPILLVGVMAGLAAVYRWGPSRDGAEWTWITPGSIFAAVIWVGGSMLFSWYVSKFGNYNETYGSLGAAIGFMTWIWLSTIIVLLGAEINAETEHQTATDTTEGPDEPLGTRGAKMADSVGEAKG
jgi:membrane protein